MQQGRIKRCLIAQNEGRLSQQRQSFLVREENRLHLIGNLQIPTSSLDLFIRSVEISSYIPGRVRLYSRKLIGNTELERQVQEQLGEYAEISGVETNITTGSVLIRYVPEVLRQNEKLRKVEEYIMTHARRK